jgi:hypothetical protein
MNPTLSALLCIVLWFAALFIPASVVTSCKPTVPPSSEVVDIPEVLKSTLPIDSTADFGAFQFTRISETKAVITRKAPAVIGKCKNCFNTTVKDKSETVVKDKSTVKNKQDQSQQKKAEVDNSIGKTESKPGKLLPYLPVIGLGIALLLWKMRKLF